MNKITNINSRRLFGEFYPQAPERVPEGMKFLAAAVLSLVAPTLAYCYVTNHAQPLYLVGGTLIIGTLMGIVRHLRPRPGLLSCVPQRHIGHTADDARDEDAA